VVCAAVDIADERGIEALTMRELAGSLGVEAASLYNHVSGKDDILDGMADWAAEQIDLPVSGFHWKEAMRRRAVSARTVFERHRWAAMLMDSVERDSPARWAYTDSVLGILLDAGFSPALAARGFFSIDSYVLGFERQAVNLSLGDGVDPADTGESILRALPPEQYPNLSRVLVEYAMTDADNDDALFGFGLELILDGLERLLV
jgi:AcrR family transcriptional regulator